MKELLGDLAFVGVLAGCAGLIAMSIYFHGAIARLFKAGSINRETESEDEYFDRQL